MAVLGVQQEDSEVDGVSCRGGQDPDGTPFRGVN